ncbi:hypothetical protein Tco_0957885, partial [Tanacetum coccineum]
STLEAANILASGGSKSVFTTTSSTIAIASTGVSPAVATVSGSFPTAAIFTTASVATPRISRSPKRIVIESLPSISVNIPSISTEDKGKGIMTEPEKPSKEKELDMMIAELDRSNEMVAKHLSEYEQAEAELSHDEKVELINELLKYQRNLPQIKKYQAQQSKLTTKTKRRKFYMSVLRSNAGTKPSQEQQSKDLEVAKKDESKSLIVEKKDSDDHDKFINLQQWVVLVKGCISDLREDLDKLWSLVKETFNTTDPTEDKEKMLWVELKRLYEPDPRDQLWALQKYMHDPLEWKLYDTCGVHHVSTGRGHEIFMLVEKDYPLTKGLTTVMLCTKLQVDQYSKMANELLMKIYIIANSPR